MARRKEFCREEVLDRAMKCFWEHGLESTSIQDLVDCMGISRASLYDTFGSKEALVFEAMDCYVAHIKEQILESLDRDGPAREVIREFFREMIERGFAGHTHSCLVTKAALMTGRANAEIMERVATFMGLVEDAFCSLIARGIEQGDIDRRKDPRALARFFVNTMQGLSVTSSPRADPESLEDVLRITLSTLD